MEHVDRLFLSQLLLDFTGISRRILKVVRSCLNDAAQDVI